jgi:hypothetical protein
VKNQLTITLLLLSTISAFAQVPNYVPTNGLVGWWPFNGNAEDESGGNHDGSIINGPNGTCAFTTDRFSNTDRAVEYAGSPTWNATGARVQVSDQSFATFTGSYSVSLFIELDADNEIGELINKGPDGSGFYSRINQGTIQFGTAGGGIAYSNANLAGAWHNLIFTRDGINGAGQLYVDGQLVASGFVAAPAQTTYDLWFGLHQYGSNNSMYPLQGKLDDIGIWDRVLNEGEIDAIANSSSSVPPPCLASTPPVITGLASSYTISSLAVPLTGSPSSGLFFGQGMVDTTFVPSAAGLGTHTIMYTYVDANGCIGTVGTCVDVMLDVGTGSGAQLSDHSGPEVYPNPGSGLYTLKLHGMSGVCTIDVTDTRGRSVHSATVQVMGTKSMHNIDLSHCANGVYTITVQSANATQTQKLVKR